MNQILKNNILFSIESNILEEYIKYDYLNTDTGNPLIKILVSYIKPSYLFKSKILTPIHLGRTIEKETSKDGNISEKDINWLHKNCIGDDDFDGNISLINRKVGFLTGTYWAWKNYEKLGNPDYFGSFGYRRLLTPEFLSNIKDYDLILPEKYITNSSNKEFFINSHGINIYNQTLNTVKKIYGEKTLNSFQDYLNLKFGYYCEIYIMKKQIFFDFCKWIFPLLFELLKNQDNIKIDENEKNNIIKYFSLTLNQEHICNNENFYHYQMRSIAFAIERLTGYYLYNLSLSNNCKSKEVKMIIVKKNILSDLRNRVQNTLYNFKGGKHE